MTMHGENIGSRKAEPEMQSLPKWRLKANYLMRQLACIWYGKSPTRDYPNSSEFKRLFLAVMYQFVKDHGGKGEDVLHWIKFGRQAFEVVHGVEITFKDRIAELNWMIRNGIPKELHEKFVRDDLVQDIILTAKWILAYEQEGKEPPYEPLSWHKPFDYYEQLQAIDPEPRWRIAANYVQRELARVWYGKASVPPWRLKGYFEHLLHSFAFCNGVKPKEFDIILDYERQKFVETHGCEPTFRTPVQEIIWIAENCLPEHLRKDFLSDPQIRFILTVGELIWALIRADLKPPYEKYAVSFLPLDEYEKLPVSEEDWAF